MLFFVVVIIFDIVQSTSSGRPSRTPHSLRLVRRTGVILEVSGRTQCARPDMQKTNLFSIFFSLLRITDAQTRRRIFLSTPSPEIPETKTRVQLKQTYFRLSKATKSENRVPSSFARARKVSKSPLISITQNFHLSRECPPERTLGSPFPGSRILHSLVKMWPENKNREQRPYS
jgi:hypothetical protein